MRRAAIVGIVVVGLLLFAGGSAATSASTNLHWGHGTEATLPANAATGNKQAVSINSVSCPSAGNCSAVGEYVDSSGNTQGLLLTETAGTWATGVEAALPANAASAKQYVYLYPVSCASPGNCTAVGGYVDSSGNSPVLLLTETDGVWGTGVEAALPANASVTDQYPFISSVSCASAGNCGAVGAYVDSSGNYQGLLLTKTAGVWATGVEADLPADAAATHQIASLTSVSCASPGNCTAVGGYVDSSGGSQALLLDETAGSWRTGVEAQLPANAAPTNLYAGDVVFLLAVSCASAGNCSAVGSYCAVGNCNTLGNGSGGSTGEEGLLLTETAGSWGTGVEAALPANAATTSPLLYINSVSCASAGNCSAVGSYFAGSDNTQPLMLTETAGAWAAGVEVDLPANAASPYQYSWVTVSCASAQDCTGVGFYTDTSNAEQGLLVAGSPVTSVVPNVKGKTVAAARRSIKSHGFVVGKIKHARSRRVKKGHVISQKPKSGKRVKRGTRVSLVVSKGR
jgi:PASTA domain